MTSQTIFVEKGETNVTLDINLQNSSDASALTGLTNASSGLVCYYRREPTGTVTQLTLASTTVGGAHTDGGFVELSSTNMPGAYKLDLSDAIVATGADRASVVLSGATNLQPHYIHIVLADNVADAVWDESTSGHTTAGTYGEPFSAVVNGQAATGTLNTTTMTTNLAEATNDHYNNRTVVFVTGNLVGQKADISDYSGTNGTITFASAVTEAPANGDRFVIV